MSKSTAVILRTSTRRMQCPLIAIGCIALAGASASAADSDPLTLAPQMPRVTNHPEVNQGAVTSTSDAQNTPSPDATPTPQYLDSTGHRRFLHAGTWELTLSGTGNNDADFREGGFGINIGVGYFPIDGLEIAVRQSATYADSGTDSSWNATTRGALDYHLDLDHFQPFIGANIGYTYGDNVSDTWEAGPEAGIKYFLKDEAFLYGQVEYQVFFKNANRFDNNFSDGQFVYTIGVGFTF